METVNQEVQTQTPETKTFTQEEVNAMISDRLQRERSKYADYAQLKEKADAYDQYEEQNKSELQKANDKAQRLQQELDGLKQAEAIRAIREKVSAETGVPVSLITATSEDECKAQAEAIKAFAKPSYPNVKDGGEPLGHPQTSPASAFADWFNAQNL